jgi:predicted outer membrane repeat protein
MAADSGSGSLITVKSGVTLTLRNITLAGKADNTTSLISVNGGHLILETGVVITGNNANTNGGGIAVTDGGILVMNGNAVISNNTARYGGGVYGGGVYVSDNGSLVMNENAVIRNNTALYGGGVYVEGSGSSFEMAGNSTVISGNTATLSGGGVYVGAGGSFNMTGGAIYGLNAGTLANNAVSGSGSTVFVSPNAAGSNVGSTNNTIVVKVIQQ